LKTAFAIAAPAPQIPSSPMPLLFIGLDLASSSGTNTASIDGMRPGRAGVRRLL
jgi:hypothetical protein